jgi:hypothetical protein
VPLISQEYARAGLGESILVSPSRNRWRKDQSRISASYPLIVMLSFNKPYDIKNLSLFAVVIHTGDNITRFYYTLFSAHELRMRIHMIILSSKMFEGFFFLFGL